jgi:hypothetical protein
MHDPQHGEERGPSGRTRLRLPTSGRPGIVYEILEAAPLIDSADMDSADWISAARSLGEVYDDFDGFCVVTGTDTLPYLSSAMSFLLPNLGKPVVITGAQVRVGRHIVWVSSSICAGPDIRHPD